MESKVDRNGVLNPWQRSSRENRLSWPTAAAEKGGGRWISRGESRNKKGNTVFTVEVGQLRAFHPRQILGSALFPPFCSCEDLSRRRTLAGWPARRAREEKRQKAASDLVHGRGALLTRTSGEREDRDSERKEGNTKTDDFKARSCPLHAYHRS